MASQECRDIWLDYREAAAEPKLLHNLSAVASSKGYLWTASDEGRTVECLAPEGAGFRLCRQYKLDKIFRELPGKETDDEADIESLDVFEERLWISGSHCRVRNERKKEPLHLDWRLKRRESRYLLGRVALDESGGGLMQQHAKALPFSGVGSLRSVLKENDFIGKFVRLPSKENGLDIEGLTLRSNGDLLLGLRGPLIDSYAVVVEIAARSIFRLDDRGIILHFLNLEGLGVRDLARFEDEIIVLAGPVSAAPGPFRFHRWVPRSTPLVQDAPVLNIALPNTEHPEGVTPLDRDGRSGLLVLYDLPHESRIDGNRYRADWFAI